jgi:hypothetical protein
VGFLRVIGTYTAIVRNIGYRCLSRMLQIISRSVQIPFAIEEFSYLGTAFVRNFLGAPQVVKPMRKSEPESERL